MEIRFLFLKILRFYVFKMTINGGQHIEINFQKENYKMQFISQNHAQNLISINAFDKCDLRFYANNHLIGLFYEYFAFIGKNLYPL